MPPSEYSPYSQCRLPDTAKSDSPISAGVIPLHEVLALLPDASCSKAKCYSVSVLAEGYREDTGDAKGVDG